MNQSQSTTIVKLGPEQLASRFEELFHYAHVTCRLTTPLLGSQPADERGIKGFVESYLKLEGGEADEAIKRIREQELGGSNGAGGGETVIDTTPEGAEIVTKQTYGIKCHRRSMFGPWLGSWQIKAGMKNAATSRELFVQKRGSKNQVTEMGRVDPFERDGLFLKTLPGGAVNTNMDARSIHLFADENFDDPAPTTFERIKGNVSLSGSKTAIMVDYETIHPGAWFRFIFGWGQRSTKLTPDDVTDMLLAMQNIGLGSGRSFDSGRFKIEELELHVREEGGSKKEKASTEETKEN